MSLDPWIKHVWFTGEQLAHAANVAREQIRQNKQVHPRARFGAADGARGESLHWIGAKGQKGASVWLDLPWTDRVGSWGEIDVGGKVEVRTSDHGTRGRDLILHCEDRDHVPFVCAYGTDDPKDGYAALLGWLWGHEGKQPEYWRDPSKKGRWAFFVPLAKLRPMDELRAIVHPAPGLHDWIVEPIGKTSEAFRCLRCGRQARTPDREGPCAPGDRA